MTDVNQLKFNADGLIPAIVQDVKSGEVVMLAYMNREAVAKTLATGKTWFYSRSRQKLWLKGETSGHYQLVRAVLYDCDADSLLVKVEQTGAACHEGYFSCFHYPLRGQGEERSSVFDPARVYGAGPAILSELFGVIKERQTNPPAGSYTAYLFAKGLDKILKKVGEEAAETIIAAKNSSPEELAYEMADLWYHCLVLLAERGLAPEDVFRELARREKIARP